jgi:hypothetical protein
MFKMVNFPSGFPTSTLLALLVTPIHTTEPAPLSVLDLMVLMKSTDKARGLVVQYLLFQLVPFAT